MALATYVPSKGWIIIPHCFRAGNKQATFWVEVHKYFVQDQTTRGKEILLQANIEGDNM